MIVEAIHPDTGERITVDIPSLTEEKLNELFEEHASDKQINSYIEKLPISAEAKALIAKIAKYTIKIGETVFRFGKKILEMSIMLASKYRHATFGVIFGALMTVIIGLLPLIGSALSAFLGPILMIFGLAKGFWHDLKAKNPELSASVVDAGNMFSPLATATP